MPKALLSLLLFALPALARGATWIVAEGGGDFASIQAALDAAQPGDTIQVRAKATAYFEKVVFPRSGTPGAPIVLEAYPGERPVLDGTGVPGAHMVLIADRSWVRVAGFEIRNHGGVNDGSGVRVEGAGSHVEIRDNDIHDIRGRSAMGITVFGTRASPIAELVIDGNTVHDCEPAPSEAITLNGNVTGFTVAGNVVRDVNNIGIDLIGGERDIQPDPALVARNGVVRGNRVERARSSYGGGYAAGIYVDGGRDLVIENNVVTESDLGIEIGAENAGITATNVVVRSNVVYRNDKAGIVFGGYQASVGRVRGGEFRNNTLWENDTLATGGGELWIQWADTNVVRNNVIVAGPQNLLVQSDAGNTGNTLDWNVWWTNGDPDEARFVWNGSEHVGLAAHRAATGQDGHSRLADPLLVAPAGGDVHVARGSPAVNAGDPATVVDAGEVDIDGAIRRSGPVVDAGADEVTCGDAVVDPGEQCDDGNGTSGDGCDANCTVTACGNGIVTAGEDCDDGGLAAGDCCDAGCRIETAGSPCDDGDPCTQADACDGMGACGGREEPAASCRAAGRSRLVLADATPDQRDRLVWKWQRGAAMTLGELGDPARGAITYTLCGYDARGVVLRAVLPACSRCWAVRGTKTLRFRSRDGQPDGLRGVVFRAGAAGSASIAVKGKGGLLRLPALPLVQAPAVTMELRGSTGLCWGAAYAPPALADSATLFKDRTP